MGDSLELIGKRLILLLDDGRTTNGSDSEQAAWARDWLRGTVRAVSVIGLAAPEVSGGEATTTIPAAGLTVSVYICIALLSLSVTKRQVIVLKLWNTRELCLRA